MAKSNRRPQAPKVRNEAYMRGMQEIRRSNAAQPIPSGKKYRRTVKHRSRMFSEV